VTFAEFLSGIAAIVLRPALLLSKAIYSDVCWKVG
jgi:hypothetical protein